MRIFKKSYADKSGAKRKENKWSVEFCDHIGVTHRISAYNDKRLSEAFGRKLEALAECRKAGEQTHGELREWIETLPANKVEMFNKWGLLSAAQTAAGRGLQEQLDGWKEHLKSKEVTQNYIRESHSKVKKVWKECGFSAYSDIDITKIEIWLNLQREQGLGATTCNHYLRALKAFLNWAVSAGRITRNPISRIRLANQKTDIRRERRPLTEEEARALLQYTRSSETHHGLTGSERELLYRVALETGLRWGEICKTERRDVSLDTRTQFIRVRAEVSKNGKDDKLPLRPELAQDLGEYLKENLAMPDVRLFPSWLDKGAEMLQRDMRGAGLEITTEAGTVDFHALRHTFGTNLANSGIHPKTAQALMRHSDINLTMNRYSHSVIESQAEAVYTLPDLTEPSTLESAKATGTDDTDDCFEDRPKDHGKNSPENRPFLRSKAVRNCPKEAISENEKGEKENAPTPLNVGFEADFVSVGEEIRTPGNRIMSPEADNCNPLPASDLQDSENPHSGLSTGIPENLRREIDIVIDAWPGLSVDIRQKILAICAVK